MTEGPRDPLPPHKAAHLVFETMTFALQLRQLGETGGLRADMFPADAMIAGTRLQVRGQVSSDGLRDKLENLVVGAVSVAAQAMNTALEEAFGKKPLSTEGRGAVRRTPDSLSDRDAAWEIVYMVRCAVSHNPFRPRWECHAERRGRFTVREIGLVLDTTALDGQPFDLAHLGGLEDYVNLMTFCRRELRRAADASEGV